MPFARAGRRDVISFARAGRWASAQLKRAHKRHHILVGRYAPAEWRGLRAMNLRLRAMNLRLRAMNLRLRAMNLRSAGAIAYNRNNAPLARSRYIIDILP